MRAVEPGERPALQVAGNRPAGNVPARIGLLIDERSAGIFAVELQGDVASFADLLRRVGLQQISGSGARRGLPQDDPIIAAHALDDQARLLDRSQRVRAGLPIGEHAEDGCVSRQPCIADTAAPERIGMRLGGQLHRLVLVEQVVGDGLRIVFQPETPVADQGRHGSQPLALARTGEGDAGQTREERAVLVFHDHDAVAQPWKVKSSDGAKPRV